MLYDFFSFVFYYGCNGKAFNTARRSQELERLKTDRLTLDEFLRDDDNKDEHYRNQAAIALKEVTTRIKRIEDAIASEIAQDEAKVRSAAQLRVFFIREKYLPAKGKAHPSF